MVLTAAIAFESAFAADTGRKFISDMTEAERTVIVSFGQEIVDRVISENLARNEASAAIR
jgi:hypothetical protein